jgi:hypothetical protein
VDEDFQEFVDGGESGRSEENNKEAGGEKETDKREPKRRLSSGEEWCRRRMEQAMHAGGKFAVAGEERSGKKRQTKAGTHAGYTDQRRGQRKCVARVSRDGSIIGGPLRKFRPMIFQDAQRLDQRKNVRGEKEEQPLGIVARNEMGLLVAKGDIELFRGKLLQHAARNEQTRMKQA